MSDEKAKAVWVELSGLWENERGMLIGNQGNATYAVFPNTKREGNQPTHRLCVTKRTPKDGEKEATPKAQTKAPPVHDDDVPF